MTRVFLSVGFWRRVGTKCKCVKPSFLCVLSGTLWISVGSKILPQHSPCRRKLGNPVISNGFVLTCFHTLFSGFLTALHKILLLNCCYFKWYFLSVINTFFLKLMCFLNSIRAHTVHLLELWGTEGHMCDWAALGGRVVSEEAPLGL